jgi:signal transduction histidine kinase
MGRHVLAVAVVLAEVALLIGGRHGAVGLWAVPAYVLVVALSYRAPVPAFVLASGLTVLTGGAYVLLLWAAYQAGRQLTSRVETAVAAGAALGGLGAQLAVRPVDPRHVPNVVCVYLVFVSLPLLAGRYLAQHRRLVSTLGEHNRRLRRERALLAEQERLRERLRIARDMHDSLGRRLGLVSVESAALEVTVPPPHRAAVRRLAAAARGATDDLHELVGALRTDGSPGLAAIGEVVGEFRAAGVAVTLRRHGEPRPLPPGTGCAAYRVVEEGLTNAAKHAPGRPVTVSLEWQPDALLVTVVNPIRARGDGVPGHGLRGLGERARAAGGLLDHRSDDDGFRLVAMLPVAEEAGEDAAGDDDPPGMRTAVLGFAAMALLFVILPAGMLLGLA